MTRLLMLGDSAGTGFGTVTRDLGRALLERGEDVRFVSLNEQPNGELDEPFAGRTAIVGSPDGWLSQGPDLAERLEGMFTGGLFEDGWAPEAAIVLGDMGSLKISPVLGFLPEGFPAFNYAPIEGIGLPPAWTAVWRKLPPVAMSEFGADEIAKLGLPRPPVVYHGVDTATFHEATARHPIVVRTENELLVHRSKAECRAALHWPKDEIILYRADRHMPRKQYPALLRAIAPVLARHPNVRLIWHCRTFDQGGDLDDECSKYGPFLRWWKCGQNSCARRGRHPVFGGIAARMNSTGIHDHSAGAIREILAMMYNAADIYVSTSAEGFGLTIAEALACGTPAIGLDFSAVPEVIGPAGMTVPVGGLVENIYSHFWARPNETKFTEAVEALVTDVAHRRVLGAKGPIHVGASFTWARAAEQFSALLATRQEIAA